ncbi:MarR family winged helix-turn-helix transcriptional regulator [Flavobacterium sp. ASW18X]|uniref:MarR family winged helix-turn-helix transcriptional regulator n=1 Tax=Flavobacterium sp. ASW18X TaxID=2572595 RepID=UPI0010AE2576|nr:MarR family transcriptional regulator [Flavobacterium sp. ASW18X]TKD66608.1 MarR family transcriptional regulator [Flavobacterium sp. ASW18X]
MLNKIDEIHGIGLHLDLVLRKIQDAYLRAFDNLDVHMTIEQWVIMHQVYNMGEEASQSELTQLNFRNRATISRVIGGLERKGWIKKTRFEGDLKRFKLELTTVGTEIVDKVLPEALRLRRLAVKDLNPTEFANFLKVLDTLGANYEAS